MKSQTVLIASVVLLTTVIVMALFSRSTPETALRDQWNELRQSETAAEEVRHIQELTKLVAAHDGYWKVFGIQETGARINLIDQPDALTEAQTVAVTFYWDDKHFEGTGWTPQDRENVFAFFREG